MVNLVVKLCPYCAAANPRATKVCNDCNAWFPVKGSFDDLRSRKLRKENPNATIAKP